MRKEDDLNKNRWLRQITKKSLISILLVIGLISLNFSSSIASTWDWGSNLSGQLGDGSTTNRSTPVHVSGFIDSPTALAGGDSFSMALWGGTVWTWGQNNNGQLGDGTTTDRTVPVQVVGPGGVGILTSITAVAAGYAHSIALRSDGTVWTWGQNWAGMLGNGTTTGSTTPVQVKGPGGVGYLTGVTAIALAPGGDHNVALKSDGTVWTWGRNWAGGLCNGTLSNSTTPVQVVGPGGVGYLTNIIGIARGAHFTIALKNDNTVWTCGANWAGQLGDGSTTDRSTPVQVKGPGGVGYLSGVNKIAGGLDHVIARKSDFTVWTWGYNGYGQLGNGSYINSSTPIQVSGLSSVSEIASGGHHNLILKVDNTVWTWGYNGYGQLGDGTIISRLTPVKVDGLINVWTISGGAWHSMADTFDYDGDGVGDWSDNCYTVFNPGQEDSDSYCIGLDCFYDTYGDACDNCPKILNSSQTDTDNDGQGDTCDPSPTTGGGAAFPSPSPVTKSPGEPLWVSVVVDQFSSSAVDTIKPDCFNTLFEVRDSLSNILPPRYRHRFAYGIPNDVMKIEAVDQVTVTCDLSEMYDPTVLVAGSYTVDATYSNYIQDPCDAQPCFDLWMGALQTSTPLSLTISGSTINKKDADITFNPQDWNAQWAFQFTGLGNVSAQISNIPGYSVSSIDPSTIRLNGTVPIITGSNSISGSVLTVQFDRTLAIQSQGTVFPGNTVYPTIQGGFTTTSAYTFSGDGKVNIIGTPSSVTAIEICDGVDNDLDTLIDENYPGGNTLCGISVPLAPSNLTFSFSKVTWSGSTTVTTSGSGPAPPSGFKMGTSSYYNVSSTAYFDNADVCIKYNPANYSTEKLKLLHYNGTTWDNITTSLNTATDIICGNTTSFSPFIVVEESSTAITLSNLSSRQNGEDVVLVWSTASETDNEGFTILRGETVNGPFTPITSSMIPAIGGVGMKAKYTYTDTNTEAGKTYYYRLQDIDSRGAVTLHNVLQVVVKADDAGKSTKVSQNNLLNDKHDTKISLELDESKQVNRTAQKTTVVNTTAPVTNTENLQQHDSVDEEAKSLPQTGVQYNETIGGNTKPEPVSHEIHLSNVQEDPKPARTVKGNDSTDSTFSVSIEDSEGNLLKISKVTDIKTDANTSTASDKLDVHAEDGGAVIRWKESGKEVKALKGYTLLRSEKGKGKYTAVSGVIPYFGHNSTDRYTYSFTDNSGKKGTKYEYKLELISSTSSIKPEELSMIKTGQNSEIKQ